MRQRLSVLCLLACATSCGPKPESAPASIATPSDTGARVDPLPLVEMRYDTLGLPLRSDSARRAIVALEDSLRRDSTGAQAPRQLYTLGALMHRHFNGLQKGTADTAFAVNRDSAFWYNEVGGDFLYTGSHLREVIRRFPRDGYAELAAWEITSLREGGECEGYIPCYLHRGLRPMDEFLRAFPRSRFAEAAVDSANRVFTFFLRYADSTKVSPQELDSLETRKVIAQYDSLATWLPDTLRARAYRVLWPIHETWGNRARAAEMQRWLGTPRRP